MPTPPDPFSKEVMQELFTNHELIAREASRPRDAGVGGVRRVGIVGGGTAGWMTALALRAQLPWLEVTVIESSSIPIIGVGEATVPSFVSFVHHYLGLDVLEFTREVQPTWKQGIRFEWGLPGSYVFQAPFDWEVNGIGMLGSMAETGDVSSFTLQAMLMARDVTPVVRVGNQLRSFLPLLSFAYHLDNPRLVRYLTKTALARGVRHVDAKITDAELATDEAPDGEPRIARLVAEDGQKLEFDLYVDCSGFRSLLLEGKLGTKLHSYQSSLFTDSAIAFNAPHGGKLKPYTTARTMTHGWCWDIPMMENDHLGYVFSSAHCTEEQALAEARSIWPELTNERTVRFRSGRHDRLWVGNVFAIGNAYAFVEPLESTGLLMITRAITSLVRAFPIGPDHAVAKKFVNTSLGHDWDRLRWFLAAHYKFNRRVDSPFWNQVRAEVDVSGLDYALEIYTAMGPLSLLPRAIRQSVLDATGIFFYGLAGLDNILLGQKVPHAKIGREPPTEWRARRQIALDFARRATPQAEALKATWERPEWLRQLVDHPSSWVTRAATYL
jgi:tryptophan halogenase